MCLKLFLIILICGASISSFSQKDSIIVYLNANDCNHSLNSSTGRSPRPTQIVKAGKVGGGYIDSIRVCNQSIGFDTIQYYLIVYSLDSTKMLEGDFYGTFSNGKLKEYDHWGRIIFDGENEFRKPDKDNTFPYSYPVGTNRTYTYKNYKSMVYKTIREVVYTEDSKKYISRLYGENGQLLSEKRGKR